MDFKSRSESFNKRFGIVEQYDPTEEYNKFRRRALNIFDSIDSHISEEEIKHYCNLIGIRVNYSPHGISYANNIYNSLENETNKLRFIFLIETIFTLNISNKILDGRLTYCKEYLYRDFEEAVAISKINLSVVETGDGILMYPSGEKVLDKELVEEVFSFLNKDSQQHFVAAVKFYGQRNSKDYIKSAESIRRCVEQFLRFKMNNQRGLDKNLTELQQRFKSDKISVDIRNIVTKVFSDLDKYFNENSKHNDGDIDEAENEFLLYQAGLLMRYINKVF